MAEKKYIIDNAELMAEWNWEKNNELGFDPHALTHGSNIKVWWKCKEGHEWQAVIRSRTRGNGCPFCKKELQTSFPEQVIYFYIKNQFPDSINRYVDNGMELDIFTPSTSIGIEYDGKHFHTDKTKEKELHKNQYFNSKNIIVIRVKETDDTNSTSCFDANTNILYYSPIRRYKYLPEALLRLFHIIYEILGQQMPDININVERDSGLIYQSYLSLLKERSVATNTKLIKEWNAERNNGLNPEYIPMNSGKKVWWKCKEGHEWQAVIASRVKGVGCPFCTNQKATFGKNDLATKHPELINEWHPTKNGELTPSMVTCGSGKKVWWICEQGHEWQAYIKHRSNGVGCPYCYKEGPKKTTNKKINVYLSADMSFYGTFDDAKSLCLHLNIDYKKQTGNISAVCRRQQKTLLRKYVLRYTNDDEFSFKSVED